VAPAPRSGGGCPRLWLRSERARDSGPPAARGPSDRRRRSLSPSRARTGDRRLPAPSRISDRDSHRAVRRQPCCRGAGRDRCPGRARGRIGKGHASPVLRRDRDARSDRRRPRACARATHPRRRVPLLGPTVERLTVGSLPGRRRRARPRVRGRATMAGQAGWRSAHRARRDRAGGRAAGPAPYVVCLSEFSFGSTRRSSGSPSLEACGDRSRRCCRCGRVCRDAEMGE
jgi:hypothetical protein